MTRPGKGKGDLEGLGEEDLSGGVTSTLGAEGAAAFLRVFRRLVLTRTLSFLSSLMSCPQQCPHGNSYFDHDNADNRLSTNNKSDNFEDTLLGPLSSCFRELRSYFSSIDPLFWTGFALAPEFRVPQFLHG